MRRAKRQDLRVLTAIMRGTVRWRPPPSETEVGPENRRRQRNVIPEVGADEPRVGVVFDQSDRG